jgi:anti-sigma factor RsiW
MPARLSIITEEDLSDYVAGRLQASDVAEIEELIGDDPRARAIVERLRRASRRVAQRVMRDRPQKVFEFEK